MESAKPPLRADHNRSCDRPPRGRSSNDSPSARSWRRGTTTHRAVRENFVRHLARRCRRSARRHSWGGRNPRTRDGEAGNAFEREAALLANLRHQALPKVMDYFSENEGDFLVMEYIPGYDLNSRVGRSPRRRRPCHPRRVCALRDSGFGEWCWGKASIEAV